ncbi:hypothetical protein KP509_34G060900 [Ceratopteris richardii]|uniref:Uncharacterized protein n=1 Tax=Ceratopteris richardii TaxID=49495 RepID=A0A8T2QKA6_CERRI|nr:hypothetical protein KP509_34G060900 [Ceratopteris richardii]
MSARSSSPLLRLPRLIALMSMPEVLYEASFACNGASCVVRCLKKFSEKEANDGVLSLYQTALDDLKKGLTLTDDSIHLCHQRKWHTSPWHLRLSSISLASTLRALYENSHNMEIFRGNIC